MSQELETATQIAREAGALLSGFFARRVRAESKGEFDIVTEADRASEAFIVEQLKKHFPAHAIVAEEGGGQQGHSEFRWYVDPLDGTTNFAHGFPIYNVTLALERAGELVAGVIFDPVHDELFQAERGGGAFLNGSRIHVSKAPALAGALLATGFPTRKRHRNVNVHFFYQLSMLTHGIRRAGSAAIDLAWVACGRLEGFWEFGLNPWDMAAGVLIVSEAGGQVSDMKGAAVNVHGPHLLADNGLIHGELLTVFDEVFAGKFRYPLPVIES
jgi:myo-inositol-1(or 4)-monophosphatase